MEMNIVLMSQNHNNFRPDGGIFILVPHKRVRGNMNMREIVNHLANFVLEEVV
jgi:hypothetical protein